ncbi:MAG: hypothetical protein ACOYOF_13135 [Verrucomicrobiaceae bacterium]
MKSIFPLVVLLSASSLLPAQDKAALREIGAVYDQIEENHQTWTHYSTAVENLEGGHSFINHLWINDGDGDEKLSKLESLTFEDHGESKLQFFFKGDQLLFTLNRDETSFIEPEPGGNNVTEKRYYFADNRLIRLTEKKGRFPAGKPTDTSAIKGREIPLSEIENADETYRDQHEMTAPLIEKLLHLNDDTAPADRGSPAAASSFTQTGDGWRVIAGSGSRDGTFALAWGLKGQSSPEGEADEDGGLSVDQESENLVNYLVNVRTKQIVGTIKGKHFGDKSTYNHDTTETAWSASSLFVAQVNSGKWATYDAHVYALQYTADGNAVSKGTDLLEPTKKAVFEHLQGSAQLKKFTRDDFTITLHDSRIVYQGGDCVVQVGVIGQIPKSEEDDSSFEATVTFKLTSDENGGAPTLAWSATEGH